MDEVLTQHEEQQINALHDQMFGHQAAAAVDLCAIWHQAEPHWSIIEKFARKIPIVGGKIAALLSAFAVALNACCPKKHAAAADDIEVTKEEQDHLHAAYATLFVAPAAGEKPCCNIWHKIRQYWGIIVKVVGKIPGPGKKIADILKKLGEALDRFCG